MADVKATFEYDANFGSAISQVKALAAEVSTLNQSFNAFDKVANKQKMKFADAFKSGVGDIGGFTTRVVDMTSSVDAFGKALDKNKLTLRQYAKEAATAFKSTSNARKLAESEVKRMKSELADLGFDASGRRKGILVTPLSLDTRDFDTKMQIANKQWGIFNKLVNDGATHLINWGKNTQWAGRQLTVGLTVPLTMFAAQASQAFRDVDKELTRFQKVYGSDLVQSTQDATMKMRSEIQALAVDIAKSYGIAVKETAGLAADLAATGLEGQKLTDSIKQTTRLAVLGEVDRQEAMKATLALQNAFNMNTKELADSINFLNAVENQTSTSLTDLTEAIPRVGPVINALGGDVKDLSVLLVAMKEGGISAAEGANAIKSGMASLINPTKQATETAKQYGINLTKIVSDNKGKLMPTVMAFQKSISTLDDFAKAQIIEQIFGKYQFARMSALFDNLNASGSQTVEVLKLMGASSADLAKIADSEIKTLTESTSMRWQRVMETIKASLLPVGESITKSILPPLEKLANFIDSIVKFAQNLPEPVKNFLKLGTALTAIAGPIIMITGVLGNFFGYIVKSAMGFVNLGRRMAGLPVEKFAVLSDEQIAAAKATDTVTVSINRQRQAMEKLVAVFAEYGVAIRTQAKISPTLFTPGSPATKKAPKRKQSGGGIGPWVPGSGTGDRVPALLEPGEFVVNKNAAKQYGGLLNHINFKSAPRFSTGGGLAARSHIVTPGILQQLISLSDAELKRIGLSTEEISAVNTMRRNIGPIHQQSVGIAATGFGTSTSMLAPQDVNNGLGDLPEPLTIGDLKGTISELKRQEGIKPKADRATAIKYYENLLNNFGKSPAKFAEYRARQIAAANLLVSGVDPSSDNWDSLLKQETTKIAKVVKSGGTSTAIALKLVAQEQIKAGGAKLPLEVVGPNEYKMMPDSSGKLKATPTGKSTVPGLRSKNRIGKIGPYKQSTGSSILSGIISILGAASSSRRTALAPVRQSRFSSAQTTQGRVGFGAQSGSWVPGTGSGDKVKALLEPGEFVVNRNAAKQYGGLLEHLNFNAAPRFARGGSIEERTDKNGNPYYIDTATGKRTSQQAYQSQKGRIGLGTKVAGASAVISMAPFIPGFQKLDEATNGLAGSFTQLANIFAFAGPSIVGLAKGLKNSPAAGKLGALRNASGANMAAGKEAMKSGGMLGRAAGLGRFGLGAAFSTAGLATISGLAAVGIAVAAYRKHMNDVEKYTKAAFTVSEETANAYGVQLQNVNDKIKENIQLSKDLGITQAGLSSNTKTISQEKKDAIISGQGDFIGSLKAGRIINGGASSQLSKNQSLIKAQFAAMMQQGFAPQDAMEVIAVSAEKAGKDAQAALNSVKPELERLSATAIDDMFMAAQNAQLEALKSLNASGGFGNANEQAFVGAFTQVLQNVNLAKPEDQAKAIQSLVDSIAQFDPSQIGQAANALEDFAKGTELETKINDLVRSRSKTGVQTASKLAMAQNFGFFEGMSADQKKVVLTADENALNAQLDAFFANRKYMIEASVQVSENLQGRADSIQSQIDKQTEAYSNELAANDKLVESENERYKNAQEKSDAFIKAKQKEIDTISKAADKYIDSLQKEARAEDFASKQRETALGGLQSLASGDVFGFLQARQNAANQAQQFGFDTEITKIKDKKDAAVEALQAQIDKEQEQQDKAAKNHENRLKWIQTERDKIVARNNKILSGLQSEQKAINGLQGNQSVVNWLASFNDEADRGALATMMINYMMQNPGADVSKAFDHVQNLVGDSKIKTGSRTVTATPPVSSSSSSKSSSGNTGSFDGTWSANGGYISGPGTSTSDSIPAHLSNGEYVVKASSVNKYGVGMLDAINGQRYADGGLVKPTSGKITNHYGVRKPYYSKNKDSRGWGIHTGTDFAPGAGTPVVAFKAGNVIGSGYDKGWGNYVRIGHSGSPAFSYYAHLGKRFVSYGTRVNAGTKIGTVGNTGAFSRGAHLHFETGSRLPWTNTSNPEAYLGMARAMKISGSSDAVDAAQSQKAVAEATRNATELIPMVAKAVGMPSALLSNIYNNGSSALMSLFGKRRHGGSMTMNKPYLVGEAGPEVVLPYGSGSRVAPIKYNVPSAGSNGIIGAGTINNGNTYINIDGSSQPEIVAQQVMSAINREKRRRSFDRSIG